MLLLLTLLVVKHFVFDFLYQPPYQWMNKGTYMHPGGILHAYQHGAGTFLALFLSTKLNALGIMSLVAFDVIVHYHIDWAKMNINKRFGWTATTHNEYWILLGLDQLFHYLTYAVIIWQAIPVDIYV